MWVFINHIGLYHAPAAKKIPENQQKEMYDIFKTAIIYLYVKLEVCISMLNLKFVLRNQPFIQNNEIFGQHLLRGGVG